MFKKFFIVSLFFLLVVISLFHIHQPVFALPMNGDVTEAAGYFYLENNDTRPTSEAVWWWMTDGDFLMPEFGVDWWWLSDGNLMLHATNDTDHYVVIKSIEVAQLPPRTSPQELLSVIVVGDMPLAGSWKTITESYTLVEGSEACFVMPSNVEPGDRVILRMVVISPTDANVPAGPGQVVSIALSKIPASLADGQR